MELRHSIPIHLQVEDKFFLNLTARQTLILGIGLAGGYMAFSSIDTTHTAGLVLACTLFVFIVAVSVLVAFVRYHHRDLELWALIALAYAVQPHCYIRGRVMTDIGEDSQREDIQKSEVKEEW